MIIEFVGHWGVGKTTLARAVASLAVEADVAFGREHVAMVHPLRACHPLLLARLLKDAFRCLPELLATGPDGAPPPAVFARRPRPAEPRDCSSSTAERPPTLLDVRARAGVSERLLSRVLPSDTIMVLVEALSALVQERMIRQGSRNLEARRGRLVAADLSSDAWRAAVEGYERTKAAVLDADRPAIVVDNSLPVDVQELAQRVLALVPADRRRSSGRAPHLIPARRSRGRRRRRGPAPLG